MGREGVRGRCGWSWGRYLGGERAEGRLMRTIVRLALGRAGGIVERALA